MNKKNIATTIILILCSCLFAVTGSTFINFLYQKNKITVEDPRVVVSQNVLVYKNEDENKTQIQSIEFNDMGLGLKPVTGKLDKDTGIPSTVTNKKGTEGLYSVIKITAPAGLTISVKNVNITTEQNQEDVNNQRKNMYVALKEVKNSANSLQADEITLLTSDNEITDAEYTLLFWLDAAADEILKGAKISFEMYFIV